MQNCVVCMKLMFDLTWCDVSESQWFTVKFCQFRLCNVSDSINDINDVWRAIWIAVVSEIWKLRNNVIFKGDYWVFRIVCYDSTKGLVLAYIKVTFYYFFLLLTSVLIHWFVWDWLSDVILSGISRVGIVRVERICIMVRPFLSDSYLIYCLLLIKK